MTSRRPFPSARHWHDASERRRRRRPPIGPRRIHPAARRSHFPPRCDRHDARRDLRQQGRRGLHRHRPVLGCVPRIKRHVLFVLRRQLLQPERWQRVQLARERSLLLQRRRRRRRRQLPVQLGICVQLGVREMLLVVDAVLLSGNARRKRAGVLFELSVYWRLREFVHALLAQGEGRADENPSGAC